MNADEKDAARLFLRPLRFFVAIYLLPGRGKMAAKKRNRHKNNVGVGRAAALNESPRHTVCLYRLIRAHQRHPRFNLFLF
jgi:hypothetical protein